MIPAHRVFVRLVLTALLMIVSIPNPSFAQNHRDGFQVGCCLNPDIKRPVARSDSTVSARVLAEALNCITNNAVLGGPGHLAKELGERDSFDVSYFYGRYMPDQDGEMLTIAIYSGDERRGYLFDIGFDENEYFVANLPELRSGKKQWQVGEINGGTWSYTRLWYLAQEIGTRPRQRVPVSEIIVARPKRCSAVNSPSPATNQTH